MHRQYSSLVLAAGLLAVALPVCAEELPGFLQDRDGKMTTSLFGTFIQDREVLVYPFYEYVRTEEEYNGEDLGISDDDEDYVGDLDGHEALLFIGYGITEDIHIEFEPLIWERAVLHRASADDSSGLVNEYDESETFVALQAQLRWRVLRETATMPEIFTWVEVDHPLKKEKALVGNADWEGAWGIGFVKGFSWGTITPRMSINYDHEEDRTAIGEWAVEYFRRINDTWRVVATVEGESDEEISIIGEIQWHFSKRAFLKLNSGFGVHGPAPDVAPEVGIMFSF